MKSDGGRTNRIYSFLGDDTSGMGLTASNQVSISTNSTERLRIANTSVRCNPEYFYVNNAQFWSPNNDALFIGTNNNQLLCQMSSTTLVYKLGTASVSGDQPDVVKLTSGGTTEYMQFAFYSTDYKQNYLAFDYETNGAVIDFCLKNSSNENIRGACIYSQGSYTAGSESCNLVFQTKPSTGPTRDVLTLDSVQQATFNCDAGSSRPIIINATSGSFSNTVMDMVVTRAASSSFWFLICRSSGYGDSEFIVRGDGNVYADGSYTSPAVDYAELFENLTNGIIPRGSTVVLEDGYVRVADEADDPDDIIGVVRGKNGYNLGGSHVKWPKKYLRDDFGDYVLDEKNNKILSDDYDDAKGDYIPRQDRRDQWSVIGLVGQIPLLKSAIKNPRWIFMREISDSVDMYLVR